jgi:hypothetical protein
MGDCCFAAGTLVHTYHGDVTIERIRAGDMVLSRNRTTGKQEYKRVTALTAQHRDKLIELRVEGEPEPLRPSINHPFWVLRGPSQQAAWIVADSMRVGDLVLDLKGEWRKVLSVKTLEGMQTVYNFEVDDNHDYFVGTTGLLVHNSFCPLFHGTDLESAFDIAEHGIETEATDFFMSSSQGEAEYYAKYNPAGGEPALVSITLPDSVAAKLEAAGDLQIINNSTYRFLPGAWQILNDLGFNLVPGK